MNKQYDNNRIFEGMSDDIFSKFSTFMETELGIKMPMAKKTMLQSRLSKRLRHLGIGSFDQYYDFVFKPKGKTSELQNMIDVVTTNKTDFFRESKHFDYLVETALPDLVHRGANNNGRKILVWSAGCSTGEEPYTIAMVMSEFSERYHDFKYSILATDLSVKVLKEAVLGIYNEMAAETIPISLKKKYLLKSKDRSRHVVRIVSELRSKIDFRQLNFIGEDYGLRRKRDIIFCRNVIIYFNRSTQEMVLNSICKYLNLGGYLFMGHSETLNGLNVPLQQAAPTIYRKVNI